MQNCNNVPNKVVETERSHVMLSLDHLSFAVTAVCGKVELLRSRLVDVVEESPYVKEGSLQTSSLRPVCKLSALILAETDRLEALSGELGSLIDRLYL